jgi:hypothetical protein
VQMARKQRAEQWAERRRQRDEEERRQRVMVITEFDAGDPEATLHALADEILKYRRAVRLLAKAVGWADAGAPFALIAPGPRWRRLPPPAFRECRHRCLARRLVAVRWRAFFDYQMPKACPTMDMTAMRKPRTSSPYLYTR